MHREKMSPYEKKIIFIYIDTQILAIFCVRAFIDNISNKFFIMFFFSHSCVCILRALSFDFVVTYWIVLLSGITLHMYIQFLWEQCSHLCNGTMSLMNDSFFFGMKKLFFKSIFKCALKLFRRVSE